jgi:hypothetical protein
MAFMKTKVLMVAFMLGLQVAAFGQRDSIRDETRIRHHERPDPSKPSDVQPSIPEPNSDQGVNPLIRIRMDAIPFRMRKHLENEKYRGWERSPVFQHPHTFDYSIDIRSGDSVKTYSFDRTGNPIDR